MNSGTWRVAAAILALVVGAWAGLKLHPRAEPPVSGVRVPAGEASAPTPSDLDKPWDPAEPPRVTIPDKLPEFSLADEKGNRKAISTWRGKSLIINFWATWCAPCRREIPLLETLSRDWSDRQVQVVGVAVDYRDKVLAYANELKIPYPLLIGEQDALDAATALGVETPVFPFTVFTDRRGQIVTLFVGELHKAQAELILSVLDGVNEGRIPLTTARHSIADGLHALAPNPAG
jgi:thiol-disulfide isomerase/thioredoxin